MRPSSGGNPPPRTHDPGSRWIAIWTTVAFVAMLLAPGFLWLGQPFWTLAPADQIQSWTWATAFLVSTQFVRPGTAGPPTRAMARAFAWGALWFLIGGAVVQLLGVPWSRGIAGASFVLAALFTALPIRFPGMVRSGTVLLGIAVAAGVAFVGPSPPAAAVDALRVVTSLHVLKGTVHPGVTPWSDTRGGALVRAGDVFLVTNADGAFVAVRSDVRSGSIRVTPLALDVPSGRDVFDTADLAFTRAAQMLRVTDLAIDSVGATPRLLVAHQVWHAEPGCFSVSVSARPLAPVLAGAADGGQWTTLFDTTPCLPPTYGLLTIETGGNLEVLPNGDVLLTVGDHGLNGPDDPLVAQDSVADYGKTIRIPPLGPATSFTLGHRNPQGLLVTRDGVVWSTEHGPRGGDELNHLVAGANYGWPLVTYGTEYAQARWRLTAPEGDHGVFVEPVQAFVPSPGLSDLIEISSPLFPGWAGDLLVATLPALGLLRVRVREGRAVVAEPIALGHRVRDLTQGPHGELVLLTDDGSLIVVEPDPIESLGEDVYQSCAQCHGLGLEGTPEGPRLIGVVGRRSASHPGFDYSAALRGLNRIWSTETLDAFLRAPSHFAPGTTMTMEGLADADRRKAVIDYLSLFN